ncbi:bifunctional 6-phosphofructo-2-kinase fructose-2,6-bisphosphate 2-phosphatase [Pholiota molesta]|nr:bifunctional 6-phosphofructo-2-kinase fructose-2,6-bisphosphate 2-phosphatase [Pholiota molesta]
MADPSRLSVPGAKVSQDLKLVSGMLQTMQDSGQLPVPFSPGIPPVAFGAGGPMLKQFDESTVVSRKGSQAPTPPMSVKGIGNKVAKPDYSDSKIVVAMVRRSPARGKSYLSNKLMIYLKWLEYDVKVFNVGQLRRTRAKQKAQQLGIKEDHTASWFSHENEAANLSRERLAQDSLEMLIAWLKQGGNVGIHASIEARVAKEPGINPAVIAANVALKVSSGDPDYKDTSPGEAKRDFLRRITEYEKVYETITEPHLSYVKISINVEGKIGGDSLLSPRGMQYADALPALVKDNIGDAPLTVWTSTLRRTIQTASRLQDEDKFNYRYRGGESYRDVVVRWSRERDGYRSSGVLLACFLVFYAYFHHLPQADLPYIKIPLHTVIKLTPKAYGCDEERYALPIQAVDTHRPKPKAPAPVVQHTTARDYYGKR